MPKGPKPPEPKRKEDYYANLLIFDRNGQAYRIPRQVDCDEPRSWIDLEEEIWGYVEAIDLNELKTFFLGEKSVDMLKLKEKE